MRTPLRTKGTGAAVAALLASSAIALTAGLAAAAVPSAKWYWSLAVAGSNPKVLLLGTSDGLDRSSDGGKTWHAAGLAGVNVTSLVEAGSTILLGGVREAAGAGPVISQGHAYLVAPGSGVLEASGDAGATWHRLHPSGLPNLAVSALAVNPADSQVVVALLRNGGVYRSTDGARSFRLVSAKVGGTPWALAITQGSHLVGGDMTSGSYLSATGADWQHTGFVEPRGTAMVMELAVDPTDLIRVLMTSYGVLISTDSGKSWHVALKSKVMFGPVAWAPGVAYAVGFDASLWRSEDGGKSWVEIR